MGLKFRRGSTAQQSGSLAFGEPYVNTTLGTLVVGGATGDIVLSAGGTGSTGNFGAISGSGLDITGNANIAGNLTLGGAITIGDATADTVNVIASLSSSLIPQTTNAFDLGSATKIWKDLYISTGSIKFVEGTTVVKTLSANTLTALEAATGSSNTSITNINSFTSSINTTIKSKLDADGVVSGSSQITYANISSIPAGIVSGSSQTIANLPTGVVSGSSQLDGTTITNLTITNLTTVNQTASVLFSSGSNKFGDFSNDTHEFTGSVQISGSIVTIGTSTATSFNGTINATNGVVSGSSQITYASISSIPSGIVSGSSQITYASISSIPSGIVSGSSQVTLSSTTGYGSVINQNLLTTSNVQHFSLGIGMNASGTTGRIDASGDIVAFSTSDINFKENITPIENPIEKIKMISGNTYDWKADMKEFHGFEGNDVGVIAQEIEAVLPQLVTTRETGYKAVKYDKLVALLIEGIKTQQNQIEKLESEVSALQHVITIFEDRMKEKGLL